MAALTKTRIGRRGVSLAGWSLSLTIGSAIWIVALRAVRLI